MCDYCLTKINRCPSSVDIERGYNETDDPNDGYFDHHEYEESRKYQRYTKEIWKDVE